MEIDNNPTHILLEKLYHHIGIAFGEEIIQDIDVHAEIVEGNIAKAIVQLDRYVWAEKLQEHVTEYKHYTSWWQRFKDEVMPKWFTKRYPAERIKTTHHWKQYAAFPKFKWFSDREQEEFVIYETLNKLEE